MFNLEITATVLFILFGIRTTLWWAKNWQLREYRWDRMRAHLETKDGKQGLWNLWFFRGILPRPQLSGRTILTFGIFIVLSATFVLFIQKTSISLSIFWTALIWERTIWLTIFIAVKLSEIPVWWTKKRLFGQAKKNH